LAHGDLPCVRQGAVIWVFISEIFPTAPQQRPDAGSFTHWFMAMLISGSSQWWPEIWVSPTPACVRLLFGDDGRSIVVVWKFFPETNGWLWRTWSNG